MQSIIRSVAFVLMVIGLISVTSGCRYQKSSPLFVDYYSSSVAAPVAAASTVDLRKFTLSARSMPLSALLRWFADSTGKSVVANESLQTKLVDLDIVDLTADEIISALAKYLGVESCNVGGYYILGAIRPEDRQIFVTRVTRLSKTDAESAVKGVLSANGTVRVFDDGLVIVSDKSDCMSRVIKLLSDIQNVKSSCWVTQLYILEINNSEGWVLGFDTTPGVVLNTDTFVTPAGTHSEASLAIKFQAMLDASAETGRTKIVSQPLLLSLDGQSTKLHVGKSVPIPQKTVSDQGTVTTTGYTYVDTGLILTVVVSQYGVNEGTVGLKLEQSSIDGYKGDAPIVSKATLDTTTIVTGGGIYLLGTLESLESQNLLSGSVVLSKASITQSQRVYQVWARTYRISGAATTPVAAALSGQGGGK